MAFILVQHLDPTHESLMVDLLAGHTSMRVQQASEGMPIERDHFYIIPPGTYLSVSAGTLHLSPPQAPHGARLPFDFLLHSLAEEGGARAVCVILSGTGADGSLGLKAVKEQGGLVIAQDLDEADFDGMPRSAIATGAVDLVLPAAQIPDALVKYARRMALTYKQDGLHAPDKPRDWLPEIIELLRSKTGHDFRLYKPGTLQRRIERRMALAAIETDGMDRYLEILRSDAHELDLLAKDLLINVTSFFRDPAVFDFLATKIIPDLVHRQQTQDQALRVWIAGCSTGEETYSVAMLCQEAIAATKGKIKLQVFASDIDADAIAHAREGFYPKSIDAEVSAARLGRFFTKEEHGYRVSQDLRACVIFTVQDVLADPPFARLDLVSCRNLLIYLQPEAQERVISLFHFALCEGGILLLGSSETIGNLDGRFEVISKPERLYRHIGRARPGEIGFSIGGGADGMRLLARPSQVQAPSRQAALAELCRRLIVATYAPAAVLINHRHECLYSLGPTDRYLRLPQGQPSFDLLAMVHLGTRSKLRLAIQQAIQEKARVIVSGGRADHDGNPASFSIVAQPVQCDGEELVLICFVDEPKQACRTGSKPAPQEGPRIAELETELEATRADLQSAIHDLGSSNEEQKAINEEALSINEEFQSTNEELLTSKEELQSLNEELAALNGQLQETLERQRTTSNDLQNILYSTDLATLFLDSALKIRFFTPATKALFNVISTDVGRPLADLNPLSADSALLGDAQLVLLNHMTIEREVETQSGTWYTRRILPYRTQSDGVEGVVITFVNITDGRHVAEALAAAKRQAEMATAAKSRFLAAASHDLRQPLQTLTLLQGLLAKCVEGERAQKLIAGFDETLGAMAGMLNALLDINQIEAGTVQAHVVRFPINDLLDQMKSEFAYHAQARKLTLHVVPCSLSIESDPQLLEQMIRNLISNALKYTTRGKVLLGCRRRKDLLSIEIWDTGIGVPSEELQAIFEEYHQLDNAAREPSRGLGLGLNIVQRLGDLLGHRVRVSSQLGKGSVFAVDVAIPSSGTASRHEYQRHSVNVTGAQSVHNVGTILVIEDDPNMRGLLEHLLKEEGHDTTTAADGIAALELATHGNLRPDVVLADYNLPNGMNGLQLAAVLRSKFRRETPVIILTGDISTATLRDIAAQDCIQLNKPVKLQELTQLIQRLLSTMQAAASSAVQTPIEAGNSGPPVIFIVDDDHQIRETIRAVLEQDGRIVEDYASCETFLEAYHSGREGCLLIDAHLPEMNGLELLRRLHDMGERLPAIMITGDGDVPLAVQSMKAGASDFIEKPIQRTELLASVKHALELSRDATKRFAWHEDAASRVTGLTSRQRQIMNLILAGHPNKNIAVDLGLSQRTVENHRAAIMLKTGSKSLPALARLALAAAGSVADVPIVASS